MLGPQLAKKNIKQWFCFTLNSRLLVQFGAIFNANIFSSIMNTFCSRTFFVRFRTNFVRKRFLSICTIFHSCFHANKKKNNNNNKNIKASFRTFEQNSRSKTYQPILPESTSNCPSGNQILRTIESYYPWFIFCFYIILVAIALRCRFHGQVK